jgi:centrosomal protein POC5
MRTWWANAARKKKREVDKKVAEASERTRMAVTVAKDDEAAELRQQLLETRRALAAEQHARELLAQDMKRSFMRGVCALNMEAMQVWPHDA